jgi:two-component system, sensor histidine kinase ChiS
VAAERGLATGAVEAILQDQYGYIWFGGTTGIGVVQYDGHDFIVHPPAQAGETGLSNGVVWDIFEDSRGELWVATDIGINRFNRDHGIFEPFTPEKSDLPAPFARSISEDDHGILWVGFMGGLGRFDPDTRQFKMYLRTEGADNTLSSENIRTLLAGQDNTVWVGTDGGSINRFDARTERFTQYLLTNSAGRKTPSLTVLGLHQTADGLVWAGTDDGLHTINPATDETVRIGPTPDETSGIQATVVGPIVEDTMGNLWIGTETGLYYLDRDTGRFSVSLYDPNKPRSLTHNAVRSLFLDDRDGLWMGHFPSGVSFLNRTTMLFNTYHHEPNNQNSLSQGSVLSLQESNTGELLIGTDGGGLNILDRSTDHFVHHPHDPDQPHSVSAPAILTIQPSRDGKFWMGTWNGGLNLFDPKTAKFSHFRKWSSGPMDNVWAVLQDSQETLWIGTTGGGLGKYNPETHELVWYHLDSEAAHNFPSNVVWSIYEDHAGKIWVGTGNGLARYQPETDSFTVYTHSVQDLRSISSDVITHIAEDEHNNLWIATRDGGLNHYNREGDDFTHINQRHGLPSNVVMSIVPDMLGNVWLGTSNGISRYTPTSGQVINFDQATGLQGNEFNIGAGLRLRSGELAFGGTYGLTTFDPSHFTANEPPPPVFIVELEIFNEPVRPGGPGSILEKVISQTEEITLSHKESVFSLTFVALSHTDPKRNEYAHKLEGFENQWNYIGTRRTATYTNLRPGEYTFRVKAANSQGVWNEEGTSLKIRVLPPPWKTWWAYSLYALALATILFWFVNAQRKEIVRERHVSARLKQLDKLKDNFLANTSHELRTPLNGIIGIAESLVAGIGGHQSETSINNLKMIIDSGKRLDRLVNDLLDFSQLKERTLKLHKKPVDVCSLVNVVCSLSKPLIGEKSLVVINNISPSTPTVYADEDRVQQIMYNLLGNAIKFSDDGMITISANTVNDTVEISVTDTGLGIKEDNLERIFDSFEQEDGSIERIHNGTGLGLTVTRQLVELHGGKITVKSTPGVGSTFTFTLPVSLEQSEFQNNRRAVLEPVPEQKEVHEPINSVASTDSATQLPVDTKPEAKTDSKEKHTILMVDDEAVNRQVLLNHLLLENYTVLQASSGLEALEIAEHQSFDLVLLDIMMPSMSGYEVCQRLRSKYPAHELPIIFLTAKSGTDDVVTGFNMGANDYLTKPVNRDELLARVKTHLDLLDINRDLERKISDRTKALEHKNQQLEKAYQKMEDISLTDQLTGLNNRRYLQQHMPLDAARIERQDGSDTSSFVFMLLDVDHFKSVNDIYGHSAGDQVLIQMAALIKKTCRESDCLIRWGGEEFLIASRFIDRREANPMAERIRKAVADHPFKLPDGRVIHKTCSIGYSSYPFIQDNPQAMTWEQVIDTADRALYAAKRSGRNCHVGLFSGENTEQGDLYKKISEDILLLIENGRLSVIADEDLEVSWD